MMSRDVKVFLVALGVVVFCWLVFTYHETLFAQQPKIIQTDYKDIGTRQRADRDIWGEIRKINRQTQADTLVLTSGNTIDTVYLDNKYSDTDYMVFVIMRSKSGAYTDYVSIPLSDSSFKITKHTDDVSTVQWMSIHK